MPTGIRSHQFRIALSSCVLACYFLTTSLGSDGRAETHPLFDGKSLAGWVTANGKPVSGGWEVSDGAIHRKKGGPRAGNILSKRVFGDFKLSFEWAIAEGGNSGLKYRVRSFKRRVLGCEYQNYDDAKRALTPKQSSASLYALYAPNDKKNLKPPGEFNTAQIIVSGNKIEHWLNREQVVSASVGDPDWDKRIASSKFSNIAGFGRNRFGRIMLTDHGGEVWYRNFQMELLPVADLQGDIELTRGESAFVDSLGRDCQVLRLWPIAQGAQKQTTESQERVARRKGKSGQLTVSAVDRSSIVIARPAKNAAQSTAVLLCSGDGKNRLDLTAAVEAARQLNQLGITAVWLKHRGKAKGKGKSDRLHDAQRAMGILRARCGEWGIEANRIGVAGIAAGGRLAAELAGKRQTRDYELIDEFDKASCRADFCLYFRPQEVGVDMVAADNPPTLLGTTGQDASTSQAARYYLALMQHKTPAELHNYSYEPNRLRQWTEDCRQFLIDHALCDSLQEQPKALAYKAKSLDDSQPPSGKTLGDHRLAQILGRDCPQFPLWPNGRGPDETQSNSAEIVTAKSRGGNALNIRNVVTPTITIVRPEDDAQENDKAKSAAEADSGDTNSKDGSDKGGAKRKKNRDKEEPVVAKAAAGLTMIVCPGGAYNGLAAEHEGVTICEWLNRIGVTAVLLKYRVPRRGGEFPKHHHALQDLQRAVRLVRANGKSWNVPTKQIGVCGFSAGGHLSVMLCGNWDKDSYEPLDDVDKQSSRPDLALLVYPAYLTEPRNSNQLAPEIATFAKDKALPTFMTVARDDPFARGMLNFFLKTEEMKMGAEAHVYASGGHGGGIDPVSYPSSRWAKAFERWLARLPERPSKPKP